MRFDVLKVFKPVIYHSQKYKYFVALDKQTSEKYLFRKILQEELQWYTEPNDENFLYELNAVKLKEVKNIEEAEEIVEKLWRE